VLKTDGNAGQGGSLLSAEQIEKFIRSVENKEGVEVLNAPQVSTPSRRQAQVQSVELHTSPSGQTYTTGQIIDVLPTISSDKLTVELVIGAQLHLPRTDYLNACLSSCAFFVGGRHAFPVQR